MTASDVFSSYGRFPFHIRYFDFRYSVFKVQFFIRSDFLTSQHNKIDIWQPPALPYRLQYSTIGRLRLNQSHASVGFVFGMRTGVSHKRIATRFFRLSSSQAPFFRSLLFKLSSSGPQDALFFLILPPAPQHPNSNTTLTSSLERR